MAKNRYLVIALLSITIISMEIIWTRLFSAEFFYTFAFLILSIALSGLGLGSLCVRMNPGLNNPNKLWILFSLTALFTLVGPPAALKIGMEYGKLFSDWAMAGKFLVTVLLLGSCFFSGGMALAVLFKNNVKDMPRLYMADLTGAALGVVLAILVMNVLGTKTAVFAASTPVILAAFITAPGLKKLVPLFLTGLFIGTLFYSSFLLKVNHEERAPVMYEHWDAMAKIKLYNYDEYSRGINIDNAANSPVYQFDGNWNKPDSQKYEFGIDVKYLIQLHDSCTFLSLGAGGGVDVLQALQEGATEIHAVEVNAHINEMMTTGILADFSGNIYRDPRVKVVTEDARSYIRRYKNKFDVIYSLSSNSFAALASGSFALAENYLFTTEAFEDYYQALSENGFMMMEHQFYMPRIASKVLDALTALKIDNPKDHIAIYDLPAMRRNMLLLSKKPLTDEIRQNAFGALTQENYTNIHLLYPAPDSTADNLINKIVLNGWQSEQDSAKINISPCTDNRPFAGQLGLWKNFDLSKLKEIRPYEFTGFPLSKVLVIVILLIIFIIILPLNLVPYLGKDKKLNFIGWLYFFSIGIAFMVFEIVLIQKFTLFIGSSSYTFMTILFTILVGSGIGSRFSTRFNYTTIFAAIIALALIEILAFPCIISLFAELALAGRIAVTVILLLPLSFFMGMPFPKGSEKAGELIDWGFAVNGGASVLGSTGILLVTFNYGFIAAMFIGAIFYLLAFVLINNTKSWT